MRRWVSGGPGSGSRLGDLGLAILRVFAGAALAFNHGINKLPPSETFVAGVAEMGFPAAEAFAWGAGASEFGGGLLLALGLLTRPAALAVASTMSVAGFVRHADDAFGDKELALLFLCVAVAMALAGPGRYSVDRWLRGRTA